MAPSLLMIAESALLVSAKVKVPEALLVIVELPALEPLAKFTIPLLAMVPPKVTLLKSNRPVAALVIAPVEVKVDAAFTVKSPW